MEKHKTGLTIFSILSILVILFPPIIKEYNHRVMYSNFSFIFNIPDYYSVNALILILELILAFFISLLLQLYKEEIKNWFNKNFHY